MTVSNSGRLDYLLEEPLPLPLLRLRAERLGPGSLSHHRRIAKRLPLEWLS